MDLQRLPLPVGGVRAWRAAGRPSRPRARRGRHLASLLGLVAAAGGAALGASPPAVTVGLESGGYRVGEVTLPARGGGVYAGPAGAVVIEGRRAASSTRLHGVPSRGMCEMTPDGGAERCEFEVGGRQIGARDRLSEGGWDRRYDDGQEVRINLSPAHPIPVPIPLAR